MPRGIKSEARVHLVHRQRTIKRPPRNPLAFKLIFTWTEGSPNININFPRHVGHDLIKVYDYATGKVTISTREEMRAHVNEYMAGLDNHDLIAHWENRPRRA